MRGAHEAKHNYILSRSKQEEEQEEEDAQLGRQLHWASWVLLFRQLFYFPYTQTLHGTAIYADQLGWLKRGQWIRCKYAIPGVSGMCVNPLLKNIIMFSLGSWTSESKAYDTKDRCLAHTFEEEDPGSRV